MPKPVIPIEQPYKPELLPVVQLAIEGLLLFGGDVFEYGSGHSTVWFARMSNPVSVEHDEEWYGEVMRSLDVANLNAAVHLVDEEDIAGVIVDYGQFDLILVDCIDRQRMAALEMAKEHVRPGGYLVLDDSHWKMLGKAKQCLTGWDLSVVSGLHQRKNGDRRMHETTFYQRPLDG